MKENVYLLDIFLGGFFSKTKAGALDPPLCLGGYIFPVPEEVVCSFFNILFDIFWAKYIFGLCVKTWRRGCGCLQLSFYPSKRVSLCSR